MQSLFMSVDATILQLGKSIFFLSLIYFQLSIQTAHNKNALQCIKFDPNHVVIYLQCIEIDALLYIQYGLFSVEEFDEEVDGEVHHQHRLLSCLHLTTEGQYSLRNEDPSIYSDSEVDPMPRAWPDLDLPKPPAAAETIPPSAKKQLVKNMMLQHDTACKVLDRLGVNACKEHHRSSVIAVLARVRRGNTLCSICGHSFSSTQSLRTHIQGQHMDASHLKCKKCDYSAGELLPQASLQNT